jgi:succinoglycan biosynthesis protein ExoM
MSASVTVVVPTFRRPDGLALALRSVLAQTGCPAFDLLVVDNDPDAGARLVADAIATNLPGHISLVYIHEPAPGVANARNAAVARVNTRYIAFLDDDQSAAPDWLQSLLACAARYPAAVTFGPVRATLPESGSQHGAYLTSFFSRPEIGTTGHTTKSFGCGNSLVDMQSIPQDRPVFDARTNETGGEDDLLFGRVRKANGRFAWCQEAVVLEHVPAARAQLRYTLRRALAYGQGPVTLARRQKPVDWPAVLFWMAVGSYKLSVNSLLYAWGWLTRSPNRAWHLDRAARGLGKLIWWVQFRFYGAAQI